MTDSVPRSVAAELVAVLVAVTQGEPRVLTIESASALPAGPFEVEHRSLQSGLRAWVETQTHQPVGYMEQLYTFADRDRSDEGGARVISVCYLGLTRESGAPGGWQPWYRYFPWEDWREGRPEMIDASILPRLRHWARQGADGAVRELRGQRVDMTFGRDGDAWNEDMVLQRYELLFEAGLVPEADRHGDKGDGHDDGAGSGNRRKLHGCAAGALPGQPMRHDHRRILATGIARLRAKIKYRPVVFELMPAEFTLLQLQVAVEALAGRGLHKQNFRRLIEQQSLVEETGAMAASAAGRPAKLFRFRGDVLLERAISGSKLPLARQA
ncbi:NUDIX hydrolase [Bordetella genomosp. 13]|uniref:NUDIX hydrolase n=1 Tax=Bordetella genomosp. 13 TaxID=463040 RepID=UPI0016426B2C|nr:hypothetical protein [Bordetella genomosp. 13]